MSNVGDINRGGCSIPWGELRKISRFEGFDSQKYRCSFLSITFFPCAYLTGYCPKMEYDSSHKSHNDKFLFRANEDRKIGGCRKEHQ